MVMETAKKNEDVGEGGIFGENRIALLENENGPIGVVRVAIWFWIGLYFNAQLC